MLSSASVLLPRCLACHWPGLALHRIRFNRCRLLLFRRREMAEGTSKGPPVIESRLSCNWTSPRWRASSREWRIGSPSRPRSPSEADRGPSSSAPWEARAGMLVVPVCLLCLLPRDVGCAVFPPETKRV